ncbi:MULTISPECIES: DUF2004 domain-containing protein [unclassified Lysobacter]|uniref:DUF2004 domain-containing protein n=1 Tax=unclassified Lysobacter TaxID=2635362 RepID=UPI001BEAE831|nr:MULTISPECIES: DUF2004 domain-containing protein [unclassified Lysobacter]MBT2750042.1 DUF2004 domain-containing protein [Lysobacter sp. ISL-50]MBT2775386.1 DUF2004 domain-containing protein [Lysobacter sp. ISL-54]MBT2783509.1 DUF2004 domain-containing protein [Lysobacter sp. ISL-52]
MASEIEKRADMGLAAIKQAFGTEADEYGATMFVKHHLEEIPRDYWQKHLGASDPEPSAVLGLLEFRSNWGADEIENFDFSLPEDVTNYVLSVHFDDAGEIDGISMES